MTFGLCRTTRTAATGIRDPDKGLRSRVKWSGFCIKILIYQSFVLYFGIECAIIRKSGLCVVQNR